MNFYIIVCGHNCAQYLDKCLESIRAQSYKTYHTILILDAPTDTSSRVAINFRRRKRDPKFPITIQFNPERVGLSHNMWNGLNLIRDMKPNNNDVVVFLDADDYLFSFALERVYDAYTKYTPLLTYGSYVKISNFKPGKMCKRVVQHPVRNCPWATSHLKTVKWKLIKHLPKEALMINDQFVPAAADRALMYSLVEMAGVENCHRVRDFIYCYRNNATSRTSLELQKKYTRFLKGRPPYERIAL